MRVDPSVFWFAATITGIGLGLWWIVIHLPNGPREQAAFGLLIVTALAFRTGMMQHR